MRLERPADSLRIRGPKPLAPKERFLKKIKVSESGCWEWLGYVDPKGYGRIFMGSKRDGTNRAATAHRLAWELWNGPITDSLNALHKCDNRKCVNPEHLFLGSNDDNTADMMKKGRGKNGSATCRGDHHWSKSKPWMIVKGEAHGNAKITRAIVRQIRILRNRHGWLLTDLSRDFGISQSQISAISRRKSWKHVR